LALRRSFLLLASLIAVGDQANAESRFGSHASALAEPVSWHLPKILILSNQDYFSVNCQTKPIILFS
jgi:hypothetical protein|tara:strand:+ start:3563 stop:3763 length:201 start_codon:yes stop_codon:yes gene_type:complete